MWTPLRFEADSGVLRLPNAVPQEPNGYVRNGERVRPCCTDPVPRGRTSGAPFGGVRGKNDGLLHRRQSQGTQRGECAGPNGKKMEVSAALILMFDDVGHICERAYFDEATVARQLAPAT